MGKSSAGVQGAWVPCVTIGQSYEADHWRGTAQELTPRAQASLVSFGERLSTRMFAAYLRSQGVPAMQHDAFAIGAPVTCLLRAAGAPASPQLPLRRPLALLACSHLLSDQPHGWCRDRSMRACSTSCYHRRRRDKCSLASQA